MFCSKCGTQLSDDARFCSSCGAPVPAPVAAPEQVQDSIYSTPEISSVEIPAAETPTVEITPEEIPAVEIPVAEAPVSEAPVNEAPKAYEAFSQQTFASQSQQPVYNQQAFAPNQSQQPVYNQQAFAPNQSQQPVYNQQAFAPNQSQQPVYNQQAFTPNQPNQPNQAMYNQGYIPNGTQAWGPMMTPKKKSKAPLIITLIIILLLLIGAGVACFFLFFGKSSPEDAVTDMLDAAAKNSFDETLEYLNPLYGDFIDALENIDKDNIYADYMSDYIEELKDSIFEDINPFGDKYTYTDFKITYEYKYNSDELEDFEDSYETVADMLETVDLTIKSWSEYKVTEAYDYEGTLTVKYDGEVYECDFDAIVVKIDGDWYVDEFELYY